MSILEEYIVKLESFLHNFNCKQLSFMRQLSFKMRDAIDMRMIRRVVDNDDVTMIEVSYGHRTEGRVISKKTIYCHKFIDPFSPLESSFVMSDEEDHQGYNCSEMFIESIINGEERTIVYGSYHDNRVFSIFKKINDNHYQGDSVINKNNPNYIGGDVYIHIFKRGR